MRAAADMREQIHCSGRQRTRMFSTNPIRYQCLWPFNVCSRLGASNAYQHMYKMSVEPNLYTPVLYNFQMIVF